MSRAELAADLAAEYGTTPEAAVAKLRDAVAPFHDPYGGCEDTCSHDLARGVVVKRPSDQMTWLRFKAYFTGESWGLPGLLDGDGPYPSENPLLGNGWLAARIATAVNLQAGRAQT